MEKDGYQQIFIDIKCVPNVYNLCSCLDMSASGKTALVQFT